MGVTVVPVLRKDDCIGAFAILQRFNDAENRQHELRNQLMHKGYRAKYGFDDVVGVSEGIERTKQILRRMAVTKSPVLLIGETGTGKELFANAVHQASRRSKGPLWQLTAPPCLRTCWRVNCSDMRRERLQGQKRAEGPGLWMEPVLLIEDETGAYSGEMKRIYGSYRKEQE